MTVIRKSLHTIVGIWLVATLVATLVACASDSMIPNDASSETMSVSTDPEALVEAALFSEIQQAFTLSVSSRREVQSWLFLSGTINSPDGTPLDYSYTRYRKAIEDGVFDNVFVALLQSSTSGASAEKTFKLLELSFGSTDSPVEQWQKKYQLPAPLIEGDADAKILQWQ